MPKSGKPNELLQYEGIDMNGIISAVKSFLNPKSEARNPKQIPNPNDQNFPRVRPSGPTAKQEIRRRV